MTNKPKADFLNGAKQIGDELLAAATKDKEGYYWQTLTMDDKKLEWQISESLYTGVAGILLFFMELYQRTGKGNTKMRYLKVLPGWNITVLRTLPITLPFIQAGWG